MMGIVLATLAVTAVAVMMTVVAAAEVTRVSLNVASSTMVA